MSNWLVGVLEWCLLVLTVPCVCDLLISHVAATSAAAAADDDDDDMIL